MIDAFNKQIQWIAWAAFAIYNKNHEANVIEQNTARDSHANSVTHIYRRIFDTFFFKIILEIYGLSYAILGNKIHFGSDWIFYNYIIWKQNLFLQFSWRTSAKFGSKLTMPSTMRRKL